MRRYHSDKARFREAVKSYQRENPEKVYRWGLRRRYGITGVQYDALLRLQRGACAICLLPERHVAHGKPIRLAVDHDHVTGNVRALLCMRCNHLLGRAKDDAALLMKAARYIVKHKADRRKSCIAL